MWGSRAAAGSLYSVNFSVFGIELADVALGIRGEPDVAVLVFDESVRAGAGGGRAEFLDLAGLGVDAAEHVGVLAGVPEIAVAGGQRIVRARADGGQGPFLEAHFDGARNDDGLGDVAFGETLGEVIGHHGHLVLGNVGAGGDHALDQQFPIGRRVPGAGDEA